MAHYVVVIEVACVCCGSQPHTWGGQQSRVGVSPSRVAIHKDRMIVSWLRRDGESSWRPAAMVSRT